MIGIDYAKQHLGLQEMRDKKVIIAFLSSQAYNKDILVDPSVTSWCAAFVNACERAAGNPGTGLLNAQSFNTYGHEVDEEDAQEGDIVVFHFPFDKDWQGHVTYFVEWDDTDNKLRCLGGNQSNSVCYANYIQDYVRHIRRYK